MTALEEYEKWKAECFGPYLTNTTKEKADAAIAELQADLAAMTKERDSVRCFLEVDDNTSTCTLVMLASNMLSRMEQAEAEVAQRERMWSITPMALAELFHKNYEQAARVLRYQTRPESAVPWEDVPDLNKMVMEATADAVLADLRARAEEGSRDE